MEFKDYYDILGVKPEADEAQIKTAYRRLARKYHPDRSKEAGAEDKFKSVSEAYEVLKDKEKRREYDQLRAGGGYRGGDSFRPPPGWSGAGGQGGFGSVHGAGDFSDFFESLFGRGRGAPGGRSAAQRGQDLNARIEVDLQTLYSGGETRLKLHDGNSERTLQVKIPAGIQPGKVIRLSGQGHPGFGGGRSGDLLLEVGLREGGRFKLDGRDVLSSVAVAPWEAALGASVPVDTLGGQVELRIPAGTQSGSRLRLGARGLPGKPAGDQLVTVEIKVPKAVDDADRAAYETFREAFDGFDPRS